MIEIKLIPWGTDVAIALKRCAGIIDWSGDHGFTLDVIAVGGGVGTEVMDTAAYSRRRNDGRRQPLLLQVRRKS